VNEGNDENEIVPSTPNGLTTRSVGLVRRGLQDLALSKVTKRVLVADDEEAINEVLTEILSSAGYEVRSTRHPSEVMAVVEAFRPQVALIGLIAPEIDGVKLSEQLSARFPDLKIVLTGETAEEGIFRHLLNKGIACDTLDLPCERNDILDMMKTWVSGSDHVDPITRLRDARHFRIASSIGVDYSKPLVISIELSERAPHRRSLKNESFLRSIGVLLARYARDGFAYRCGETQFAMLLPHASKEEGFTSSTWLMQELKALLNDHNLSDDYFPAISIISLPDDARSIEQVEEAVRGLLAQAKTTETNIALSEPLEPIIRDTWTGLFTERFFMEAFSAEWKRSERNKLTFSLIDVDLGDIDALLGTTREWLRPLLSQMGDTIDTICRRSDVSCHYNLGEFLILLPETTTETACSFAQQLHSRLKETAAHVLSDYRPPLTVSVVTYPVDGTTPVDLIHSLDDAMLLLKNSTRDGVAAANKGILSPL